MKAGDLSERITLQRKQTVRDAAGGEAVSWLTVAEVWAAVEPLTGREWVAAKQLNDQLTVHVRIRYRADVSPEWRMLWRGTQYDIIDTIDMKSRKTELQMMCKGIVNV